MNLNLPKLVRLFRKKAAGLKELTYFDNFWQLTFNRMLFPSAPNIYVIKGMQVYVDHLGGDANGLRSCLASPMYKRFLPLLGKQGPITLLDLGANYGGFSLMLSVEGFDLSRVVAVEMNPTTSIRLRFNLETNLRGPQVICVNAAVAGSSGNLLLSLGRGSTGDSLYNNITESQKSHHKEQVRLMTLDNLINEYLPGMAIDICKMDVEGAEGEIFNNPGHSAIINCHYLIIELHGLTSPSPDFVIDRLGQLGFSKVAGDSGAVGVHLFRNTCFGSTCLTEPAV